MNLCKYFGFLITLGLLCSCASIPPASLPVASINRTPSGGTDSSGGGGTEAGIEFAAALKTLIQELEDDPKLMKLFPEFSLEKLRGTLTAKILPLDHLHLTKTFQINGKNTPQRIEIPAANYSSDNRIEVNKALWPRFLANKCKREILVLHEALGLLELEKDSYPISSRLCKPYGDSMLELPPTPPQHFVPPRRFFMSSTFDFVRTDEMFPKSAVNKKSIEQLIELRKANKPLTILLVDSETEWIIVTIWNVIREEQFPPVRHSNNSKGL